MKTAPKTRRHSSSLSVAAALNRTPQSYPRNREKAMKEAMEAKQLLEAQGHKFSLREIASFFHVPHNSLSVRLRRDPDQNSQPVGAPPSLDPIVEDKVADFIRGCQKTGFPVTRRYVALKIAELASSLQLTVPSSWRTKGPSAKWFRSFESRHNLGLRRPQGTTVNRVLATNPFRYYEHFELLKQSYDEHLERCRVYFRNNTLTVDSVEVKSRIVNMDETGIAASDSKRKLLVYATRGTKNVRSFSGDDSLRITCVCTSSAAGISIPLLFILQGKTNTVHESLLYELENDAVTYQTNAWMDAAIFKQYLELLRKSLTGPILLLLDNCPSHWNLEAIEYAYQNDIFIQFFPPNATHNLQPNDANLFAIFKTHLNSAIDEKMREERIGKVDKLVLVGAARRAWKRAYTVQSVSDSWRRTGCFPWNPRLLGNDIFDISDHLREPINGHWYDWVARKKQDITQEHDRVNNENIDNSENSNDSDNVSDNDKNDEGISTGTCNSITAAEAMAASTEASITDSLTATNAATVTTTMTTTSSLPVPTLSSFLSPSRLVLKDVTNLHCAPSSASSLMTPFSSPRSVSSALTNAYQALEEKDRTIAEQRALIESLRAKILENQLQPPILQQKRSTKRVRLEKRAYLGTEAMALLREHMDRNATKSASTNHVASHTTSLNKENILDTENSSDEDRPIFYRRQSATEDTPSRTARVSSSGTTINAARNLVSQFR